MPYRQIAAGTQARPQGHIADGVSVCLDSQRAGGSARSMNSETEGGKTMSTDERLEREGHALAMALAGVRQGLELAPDGTATWFVLRTLAPEFERRLSALAALAPWLAEALDGNRL